MILSDAEKARQILKAFHDIAHENITITIGTSDGWHGHFGESGDESENGFSGLLDELYKHFVTGKKEKDNAGL